MSSAIGQPRETGLSDSNQLGFVSAFLSMTLGCLGQGFLVLGYTYRSSGIVLGTVMLIISGVYSCVNCLYMSETIDTLEERDGEKIDGPEIMATKLFPKFARFAFAFVVIVQLLDLFLTAISALIFCTTNLQILVSVYREPEQKDPASWIFFTLATIFVSIAAFVHDLAFLKKIAWTSTLCMTIVGTIMATTSFIVLPEEVDWRAAMLPQANVFGSFGTYTFAYALACTFPYIKQSMKNPKQAGSVAVMTHAMVGTIYAFIGALVCLAYGANQESEFFMNSSFQHLASGNYVLVFSVCIIIAFVPAFFLYSNPVFVGVEDALKIHTYTSKTICRSVMIIFMGFISFYFKDRVQEIIDISGGVTTTILCLIFPPLFFLVLKQQNVVDHENVELLSKAKVKKLRTVDWIISISSISFGLFFIFSGIYSRFTSDTSAGIPM